MAASHNLPQFPNSGKSAISRSGVLTIHGFGIRVRMQSGHLEIEDGIGPERRKIRLARVGHGLKRLVLIGSDGFITLEALHWLTAQDVAFVMLERDGKVLCVTGPVRPSDARLRRAQALAEQSRTGIRIARELIDKKLAGQEQVARHKLLADESADTIHRYQSELAEADTVESIRLVESQAARTYWTAWQTLPVNFPRKDASRVPVHWRMFGARVSPLTGSPRIAANPPNAMLNYLYALLESESRLAAAALGLDPGLGVLHVDTPARDSLACDLMEPVRPQVDAFLLDWITRDLLKREWFFERPDGNCRLMSSLAVRLSETAPVWSRAVAPYAEMVARMFWAPKGRTESGNLPTRLTQRHKREAKGSSPLPSPISPPRQENLCHGCGKTIRYGREHCSKCGIDVSTKYMLEAARLGRMTANSPAANAKRGKTQRLHAVARSSWNPASQPEWLTEQVYSEKVQPLLAEMSGSVIAKQIGVTRAYAGRIREGYRPHPRHWQAIATLAGISESDKEVG